MSEQTHQSDPKILDRRTLRGDHRVLAGLLRPGMAVLDVGCGTGAITAGIAEAVGPEGRVVGVDKDERNLARAREMHGGLGNLSFLTADAMGLDFCGEFDVVTAARTLQWIAAPGLAMAGMVRAARVGGLVVVLDYDHVRNGWSPEVPEEFGVFYRAFLAWREANGWDNAMAAHLPGLFGAAGLEEIASCGQDEVTERGEADFEGRAAIWLGVIEHVGAQVVEAGFCSEAECRAAGEVYGAWVKTGLVRQTLAMGAVTGRVG